MNKACLGPIFSVRVSIGCGDLYRHVNLAPRLTNRDGLGSIISLADVYLRIPMLFLPQIMKLEV